MKEFLVNRLKTEAPAQGRNLAREYLQARILGCLQRNGAMIPLAFHGGTALRFLYNIPRYSEDLDFTLEAAPADFNFRSYLRAIQTELTAEGYPVEIRINEKKVVFSALVRFAGLLFELGISPHKNEVLSIKIEVDTNPPAGAVLDTSVVRRFVALQFHHHDRASLLAGKLHAVLQRSYTKGRDLYDLFWYLSDQNWPAPNLELLNNALPQTGWAAGPLTSQNWHDVVSDRLQQLQWDRVVADVSPFLEAEADVDLLTLENLLRLLR